jgi:ABC-type Fe3+ transport system permease subunit
MKKLQRIIISTMAVLGLVALPVAPVFAEGSDPAGQISSGVNAIGGDSNQPKLEDGIKTIVNVLLFVLGAIAVVMIIIGGIRYTTSNGESAQITSAKNTILYAVVGLVVAILAYAIVNFVIGAFKSS